MIMASLSACPSDSSWRTGKDRLYIVHVWVMQTCLSEDQFQS